MSIPSIEHKGHCASCKINWFWVDAPLLARANCQVCGTALVRTSPRRYGASCNGQPTERPRPKLILREVGQRTSAPVVGAWGRDAGRS